MTASLSQEIEAKYEVLSPALLRHLATTSEIASDFIAGDAVVKSNHDVYYDTAAYDLLRRGLALRVRQSADTTLVTAKTLDENQSSPVMHRIELEYQVEPNQDTPPYLTQTSLELQRLVSERNPAGADLLPVLHLFQTRTKRLIRFSDVEQSLAPSREAFAELSLDHVQVRKDAAQPSQITDFEPPSIATFNELELELLPKGDYALLQQLANHLAGNSDLRRSRFSKLEAGLTALSMAMKSDEQSTTEPEMSIQELCRLLLRKHAMQLIRLEHSVRTEMPDYVKSMHDTTLLARTVCELGGSGFPPQSIESVLSGLQRLAKHLGHVRDLDSSYNNLMSITGSLPQTTKTAASKIVEFTQNERQIAWEELIHNLDSAEHAAFITQFVKLSRAFE